MLERDLIVGAVGDGVEGMTSTEGAKLVAVLYCLLNLFDGGWLVEMVGVEGVISRPVGSRSGGCLLFRGDEAREHGSSKDRAGAFEELSFIHDALRRIQLAVMD